MMPGGRNPYRSGYHFQNRVKTQLRSEGWNVITQPKSAFPDLICWRRKNEAFEVMMVECKVKKYLSKLEKEELKLIDGGKCNLILVAYRGKNNKIVFYDPKETKEVEQ